MNSTLSKEEILDKHFTHDTYMGGHPIKEYHEQKCRRCDLEDYVYVAMDEYAQQESRREAIEFGKFLGGVQSGKIKVQMHLMITFDELYDLYTKQKQG